MDVESALTILRTALLALKPDGADGFEGFLATVLSTNSNLPVRLAKSGTQFGQDAAGYSESLILSIEAKRYDSKLPTDKVLSKPTSFLGKANPPDLWILGATIDASTQITDSLTAVAEKTGIAIEVLDWPKSAAAPPLAAFCLLAPDAAQAFLEKQIDDVGVTTSLSQAFEELVKSDMLRKERDDLADRMTAASIGMGYARERNREWLTSRFRDREKARAEFGQRVAPLATAALPLLPRKKLTEEIQSKILLSKPGLPVFLVGGQGFGKSWVFANAWTTCDGPFMLFLSANDAAKLADTVDLTSAIVDLMINQTGDSPTRLIQSRWKRRLDRWKDDPETLTPRFVIYVDGINQRDEIDWITILNKLQLFCIERGGTHAVSVRPALYNLRINQFPKHEHVIKVNNWSDAQLAFLLQPHGMKPSDLSAEVAATLRNPRLCAIGFELVSEGQLNSLAELTVSRLLHEQIVSNETIPPAKFQKILETHAKEVLERRSKKVPSADVFEQGLLGQTPMSHRLNAIAQDGYFSVLPEDGDSYQINSNSLSLGLGLYLVRRLQKAYRDGEDIETVCANILDPIEAVDETAMIVLDALMLASTNQAFDDRVVRVLVSTFVGLQNLDSGAFEAFAALGRSRPQAYLHSLQDHAEARQSAFNHDWLLLAAIRLAESGAHKDFVCQKIEVWLSTHCLNPEISARHSKSGNKLGADEISAQQKKIDDRLDGLSVYERSMLEKEMSASCTLRSYALIDDALMILRPLNLASMVRPLVRYVLGAHINAPRFHSLNNFEDLIGFNRRDWMKTRGAILEEIAALENSGASNVGKWTIASLYAATGHPDDAFKAIELRNELASDEIRKLRAKWKNDVEPIPYNPEAVPAADKLKDLAKNSEVLDLTQWRSSMGQTVVDHAVKENIPVLAGFKLSAALALQRRMVDEALQRDSDNIRFAIFNIQPEAAAFTKLQEGTAIAKAFELAENWSSKDPKEMLVPIQFLLLAALTGRNGNEQIDILMKLPSKMPMLVAFDRILNAPDAERVQNELQQAVNSSDPDNISRVLRFAVRLGDKMTIPTIELCEKLLSDPNSFVRASAMEALAEAEPLEVLDRFAITQWSAHNLNSQKDHFERWYGSHLLISAARTGRVENEELLTRIPSTHFNFAISEIGEEIVPYIMDILGDIFDQETGISQASEPPIISRPVGNPHESSFVYVSLDDRVRKDSEQDFLSEFADASESDAQFRERQERRYNSYQSFLKSLAGSGAADFLGDIGFATLNACHKVDPDRVAEWGKLVLDATDFKRRLLKNVGLHIARVTQESHSELSQALLSKLIKTDGFVRLQKGVSKTNYDAIAVWASAETEESINVCYNRMDQCCTDSELFNEVLAALLARKAELIAGYVEKYVESDHPMEKARALMVAGCGNIEHVDIDSFLGLSGPVGTAANLSRQLKDKMRWAQHWWAIMTETTSREEYWRASVLFRSCVDGRFDTWEPSPGQGDIANAFGPTLEQDIRRSIERSSKELDK